jgi:hypothetical protein
MSDFDARQTVRRLPAVIAAAAIALGVSACGDSDDGDAGGNATAGQSAPASTAEQGASTNADEKEIVATMRSMRQRYNSYDGAAFCSELSKAGLAEVQAIIRDGQYAKYIKSRDCPGFVSAYARQVVARDGIRQRPIEVKRVTVKGDKATLVMKGGLAGFRSVVPFRFVKEGGEWKLVDPISAARNTIRVETE